MNYEDVTLEDAGYIHESNLPDLDHLRDHVQGMIDAMYKTGDVGALESSLDEVCYVLGIKLNEGEPKIEKAQSGNIMQWYLGYQRALLDQNVVNS